MPFPCLRWLALLAALALHPASFLGAQDVLVLPETVVTAERTMTTDSAMAVWNDEEIAAFSPRTIDELLQTEPAFSLYRRQSSLFGNPTSAGVSLRRTGATAAARTLVLRDGIPQNDPFGGWISWARYHPELLAAARIIPAAQSAAWGNQSPAGIVQLTSRRPSENQARLQATGGSQRTWGFSAVADAVSSNSALAAQVAAFTLQSDGFYGLHERQRGPVDHRLDLDTRGAEARFLWNPAPDVTVEPFFSYYEEERGNGTALARNSTEALDLSLRVTREGPDQTWQGVVYYQHRKFDALFSSVNETRTSESPALDQFDVPGEGLGGGITTTLHPTENLDLILGADLRYLRGETNENAGFVNGAFLRRRQAGGDQYFGGVFARASHRFASETTLDASARLDLWALRDGERVERRPSNGALLRNERFQDREGFEPSVSLELTHPVTDSLTLNASAGTSFRLPTINELYRPFRVRNDITEAKATLDPERFFSIEAGVAWQPGNEWAFSADVFHHWIRDAIANVPLTDPNEAMAVAGFIPPGGSVSQRRNVDAARVWGGETRARWEPSPLLALSLSYLFTHTEFVDSPDQALLEGNRFPQAPTHRLVAGLESNPLDALLLFAQVDFGSSQYDDALERRRLASWSSTRLGAEIDLTENLAISARVENVFDEEIATGLSTSGLRSIGTPRSFWMDVRYSF